MKYDRLQSIKRLLMQEKKVLTVDLSERFDVSIETIRRDLDLLESEGLVRKIYGGAEIRKEDPDNMEMDEWNKRCQVCVAEKRAIAQEAIRLIPDSCSVVLDSGTTTYQVGCLLAMRRNVSVLTNSLHSAMAVSCRTDHSVYLLGGQVKKGELITTGLLASDFLDSFGKIDVAVIGVDGLTLDEGIMDYSMEMCLIKQRFLRKSDLVIAVTDHTKFNVRANYRSCALDQVDYLITDAQADRAFINEMENRNVKVIIADGER